MNVKITLSNNYFYRGEVISETEDKLIIKDIKGSRVEISKSHIISREEVQ